MWLNLLSKSVWEVEGHFNPRLFNPKLQPQTFQPKVWLESSWLKSLELKVWSWSLGLKSPGLKCPSTVWGILNEKLFSIIKLKVNQKSRTCLFHLHAISSHFKPIPTTYLWNDLFYHCDSISSETTYRTRAIIGRSRFEAALVYKPRILSLKNEEFPFLVHKLSVI